MKVTRSYWMGLGSGLILSAMFTLVISLYQVQVVIPPEKPLVLPSKEETLPLTDQTKQATPHTTAQTIEQTKPVQDSPNSIPSSPQIEWTFVVPDGSSADQIAELLVAQGFLKDKANFLEVAHQQGVESQFRAGTFTLILGLTSEELTHRLLKM